MLLTALTQPMHTGAGVNDASGAPLKFEKILYTLDGSKSQSATVTNHEAAIYAVGTDGLVYSWGGNARSSHTTAGAYPTGVQSVASANTLFRTASTALESATPAEATFLNDIFSRKGTKVQTNKNGDGDFTTFEARASIASSTQAYAVAVGEDGKLYGIYSNGRANIYSLNNGVKIVGMIGNSTTASRVVLGEDGVQYEISPVPYAATRPTVDDNPISVTAVPINDTVANYTQNGMKFTDATLPTLGTVWAIEEGTNHVWLNESDVWVNYTTVHGVPESTRIIARSRTAGAAIFETTTGQNIAVSPTTSNVNEEDFNGGIPRDLVGEFLDSTDNKWSLMYSCIKHIN